MESEASFASLLWSSALISLQFTTESLNTLTPRRQLNLTLFFRNSKFTLPQIDSCLHSLLTSCLAYTFSFTSPQLSPFPLILPVLIPIPWFLCMNSFALYFTVDYLCLQLSFQPSHVLLPPISISYLQLLHHCLLILPVNSSGSGHEIQMSWPGSSDVAKDSHSEKIPAVLETIL